MIDLTGDRLEEIERDAERHNNHRYEDGGYAPMIMAPAEVLALVRMARRSLPFAYIPDPAAAIEAVRKALEATSSYWPGGCASVDTMTAPPCGYCPACEARAALALLTPSGEKKP